MALVKKLGEKEIAVPVGSELQKVCEDNNLSINFGCRNGKCASCIIEIKKGLDCLNHRTHIEDNTLNRLEKGKEFRLACQVKIETDGKIEFE